MNQNIWSNYDGFGAELKDLKETQEKIGVNFPKDYIEIVLKCDGGSPEKPAFKAYSNNNTYTLSIGSFLKINNFNLLKKYMDPPEYFPEGLVGFAVNGGGDYICFDYRKGNYLLDPPIVFWDHGQDDGKDVYFIANNFKEFLDKLEPYSEF